jgi:transcriptional regulator with XRE-family HTH domain
MTSQEKNFYCVLGSFLRVLRKINDLTLVDTSKIIGVAPQQMQKYELGENPIKSHTVNKLFEYYKISVPLRVFDDKKYAEGIGKKIYDEIKNNK